MEVDDQELLWCIDCMRCHGPECPQHGEVIFIKDTPTLSRAVASLPTSLYLQTIEGQRQVVAKGNIARRTQFGPLEATESTKDDEGTQSGLILKIFKKDGESVLLDTSDEMKCNWMSLVTKATEEANQNLIVYPYKGGLYFTVIRDIVAGEALRVWYAPHYAVQLDQPLLKETVPSAETSENDVLDLLRSPEKAQDISGSDDQVPNTSTEKHCTAVETPPKKSQKKSPKSRRVKKKHRSKSDRRKQSKPGKIARKQISPKKTSNFGKRETMTDKEYKLLQDRVLRESVRSCHECALILDSTDQLQHHIKTEHQQDPVQCPHCVKICLTTQHLSQHIESIHKENEVTDGIEDYNLGCPLCDRYLSTTHALRLHHQLLHTENFSCTSCKVTFWNQTKYLLHVKDHKVQNTKIESDTTYSCGECSREFSTSTGLRIHEASVHMEKVCLCTYCEYSALTKLTLHEHILSNHPENNLDIPESQKLYCDKCNSVFLRRGTLHRHQLNHKKVEFKCEKCDKTYRRKDSLKKHNCLTTRIRTVSVDRSVSVDRTVSINTMTEHVCNTANVYECQICLQMYSNKSSMRYHTQTHSDKIYTCNICNKEFHKRFSFDSHKFQHLRVATNREGVKELIQIEDKTDEIHSCHLCPCQFTRLQPLLNHLQKYHSVTSNGLICIPCQRFFPTQDDLAYHETQHYRVPLPEDITLDNFHGCPTCCKVFISDSSLQSHKGRHDEQKNHVCEFCGSRFRRADGLKQHIRGHHEEQETSVEKGSVCLICSKYFKVASSLRHHLLLHTNQRHYQCPHCEYSFIQRGNFNRHVMGHGVEQPVTCDVCNKVFKRAENLRRHMLVHKVYEHSCPSCKKKFSTEHFLENHIRKVHQGEEACQCECCGTNFTAFNSYRRHMRMKHSSVLRQDYAPLTHIQMIAE
ncbi:PR domain zinc finger protein 15-like [Asterias amurensis]|uniref:PR domain zinc finger protein 15-like n=1 Tax=Asterias amurensis TaxID=7602 RepID=UPI003AB71103